MLTGDKLETATCTAKNAHLVTRSQDVHIFRPVKGPLPRGGGGGRTLCLPCNLIISHGPLQGEGKDVNHRGLGELRALVWVDLLNGLAEAEGSLLEVARGLLVTTPR